MFRIFVKTIRSGISAMVCASCLVVLDCSARGAQAFDSQRAAQKIDALIVSHLKAKNLEPNSTITDDQLVRRTYLAIIGRIPTLAESAAFLSSNNADKYSVLVKRLLAIPNNNK